MVKLTKIPAKVLEIISILQAEKYEVYAVGGCVRDSLLGITPKDWDITTNAKPDEVMHCFGDYTVIPTGIAHGTVTVLIKGEPFEITTYRTEGKYSDCRRPDSVLFSSNIIDDLVRRDFTINAMAWNLDKGLIDPFGGQKDLAAGLISCVGKPEERFCEDALRILRCVRFAAVLGFDIEENTANAMLKLCQRLDFVARERVRSELLAAIAGRYFYNVFIKYSQILFNIVPELAKSENFEHNSPYHIYNVYEHTLHAIEYAPPDPIIRMALLLHDIGKPSCYKQDADGTGHFKGHPEVSAEIAEEILQRLRFSAEECGKITALVRYHDVDIPPTYAAVKRWLGKLGAELFADLITVKKADAQARAPIPAKKRFEEAEELLSIAEEILAKGECYKISMLAVSGNDIIDSGVPKGKAVGEMLQTLLERVIDEKIENKREALLEFVKAKI